MCWSITAVLLLFQLHRSPLPAPTTELEVLLVGRSKVLPGLRRLLAVKADRAGSHPTLFTEAGKNCALPTWHSASSLEERLGSGNARSP